MITFCRVGMCFQWRVFHGFLDNDADNGNLCYAIFERFFGMIAFREVYRDEIVLRRYLISHLFSEMGNKIIFIVRSGRDDVIKM